MDEITDAYQTVGILLRAKINILCNEGKFFQARELQRCYDIINKHTDNSLDWKGKVSDGNT